MLLVHFACLWPLVGESWVGFSQPCLQVLFRSLQSSLQLTLREVFRLFFGGGVANASKKVPGIHQKYSPQMAFSYLKCPKKNIPQMILPSKNWTSLTVDEKGKHRLKSDLEVGSGFRQGNLKKDMPKLTTWRAIPVELRKKKTLSFHFIGCLLGILMMVCYDLYKTGSYNPLYNLNNQGFCHCSLGGPSQDS